MSSIVKVKNPNGTTHLYSNTTYWDKEEKNINTKEKLLVRLM